MKTYEKFARSDEQKLLSNLLPRRMLQPRQKTFWRIETDAVQYELIALGRVPIGVDVTEHALPLALIPLDNSNDIFFNETHERITGKYRVVTKAFTGGTDKLDSVEIHWDNVLDWFRTNCTNCEKLGLTIQTTSKKRTHLSTQETIQSTVIRMYYKFNFL